MGSCCGRAPWASRRPPRLSKETFKAKVVPALQCWLHDIPPSGAGESGGSELARLLERCLQGAAPPVIRGRQRIFFAPDLGQVAIENILDMAWIEDVEGDLPRPASQFHRAGARALQPAVF